MKIRVLEGIAMISKYCTRVEDLERLTEEERGGIQMVADVYPLRVSEYYASLIDWEDPLDPLRRIVIPDPGELEPWGRMDPSSESSFTVAPGLQHKYRETALLLVSDACGGQCRFCFRKRIFIGERRESVRDLPHALEYIRRHTEITNVLLTGGDPLMLDTDRLESIVRRIREIEHVHIIRIGSKLPAYDPGRILDDPRLLEMFERHSTAEKRIYVMSHFNHPRELSDAALEALALLQKSGAIVTNQTPLLRGINDDPDVLAALFKRLSFIGVPPYYVFQCRPAVGNRIFCVPLEEGYTIFERARMSCSGLAKRARFVMSHASGKIEVVGVTGGYTFMKYHQAADPDNLGRFMVFRANPAAYWFDDYLNPVHDAPPFPSGFPVSG